MFRRIVVVQHNSKVLDLLHNLFLQNSALGCCRNESFFFFSKRAARPPKRQYLRNPGGYLEPDLGEKEGSGFRVQGSGFRV